MSRARHVSTIGHDKGGQRVKFYTPAEVEVHNFENDLWMSWLGNVYNLTELVVQHQGDPLLRPILANGGKDISHWFDYKSGDLKTYVHPLTNLIAPYTPMGRFIHVPPPFPTNDWNNDTGIPWWLDQKYCIGKLTGKVRKIRIINTLTSQEHTIEVATEETLREIQERYFIYNAHARGYTWKRLGRLLDMTLTLVENGIKDESELFEDLKMDEDKFLPAIHLYFSDDLSVL